MTFLVYTEDTNKVIARSAVRSALDPALLNLRKEPDHIKEYFDTHHQLDRLNLEMNFEGIVQPTEGKPKGPRYIADGIPNVVYFDSDDKDKHIFCNENEEPLYPSDDLPAKAPPKILQIQTKQRSKLKQVWCSMTTTLCKVCHVTSFGINSGVHW